MFIVVNKKEHVGHISDYITFAISSLIESQTLIDLLLCNPSALWPVFEIPADCFKGSELESTDLYI